MRKKNILVFPCGSEIGLEIHRSLCFSSEFELYGASSVDDHGAFLYDNYIPNVPFVDSDDFLCGINKIVEEFNIDFIFPAHDSVVLKLAQKGYEVNAEILTSEYETCDICRSKKKTYEKLKRIIKTPKLFESGDDFSLPVFLKPDVGQGSKGTLLANSMADIKHAFEGDNSLLISEYLPGEEYTVDCFTDKEGELLFFQARIRGRTMDGISVNSKPVFDSEVEKIALLINGALKFRGVWFFQLKKNKYKQFSLLEVAPRIAGTMTLCRMQGVNLPLLTLYDRMEINFSIPLNLPIVEIDRSLGASYRINIEFNNVYVIFEETIISNGKVNTTLLAFIYELLNRNKNIYLFANKPLMAKEQLSDFKINKHIFEGIYNVDHVVEQIEKIQGEAIVVSDFYITLLTLYKKMALPFFKTDTIECLL